MADAARVLHGQYRDSTETPLVSPATARNKSVAERPARVLRFELPWPVAERTLRLRTARVHLRWSVEHLAGSLGVSKSIVCDLLSGERSITDDRIRSFKPVLRAAFERPLVVEMVQLSLFGGGR